MLGSTVRTTYVKTFVSSHCIDLALFVFTAAGSDKVEVKDQQTQTAWSMASTFVGSTAHRKYPQRF